MWAPSLLGFTPGVLGTDGGPAGQAPPPPASQTALPSPLQGINIAKRGAGAQNLGSREPAGVQEDPGQLDLGRLPAPSAWKPSRDQPDSGGCGVRPSPGRALPLCQLPWRLPWAGYRWAFHHSYCTQEEQEPFREIKELTESYIVSKSRNRAFKSRSSSWNFDSKAPVLMCFLRSNISDRNHSREAAQ